jgi:hypothetical protein
MNFVTTPKLWIRMDYWSSPLSLKGVESPQVTETKEKVETNWSQAGELEEGVQITQNGLVHLEIQQIEDGDSAAIGSSKEENEAQSPTSHHEGQDDSVANVHRYFHATLLT